MRAMYRLTCVFAAVCVLHLYSVQCFAAGEGMPLGSASSGVGTVTTSDPQFIPLSEEQEIKKGLPWYVYVIGVAVIAAAAAAAGGGGGGGGSTTTTTTTPSTGTVTGTW
jgi:hypothetical protein